MSFHEASVQDRDRAPAVILRALKKVPHVRKIWANGGYRGKKLAPVLQIVSNPIDIKVFMFRIDAGSLSGPSPECAAVGVSRRTTNEAWRPRLHGRIWLRAAP